MKKIKMKRVAAENLYSIVHQVLATDHYTYGSTVVEAKDPEEALHLFNTKIANDKTIIKAKDTHSVYPFVYFKKEV